MKKINKILSIIMVMILMCLAMVDVYAVDVIVDTEYVESVDTNIEINYEKYNSLAFEGTNRQEEINIIYQVSEEYIFTNDNNEIIIEGICTEKELMPMMAKTCYDYNTVDDCMRDISSTYGFSYSSSGNGYTCSGNYSVAINNSHNYLNVILSYNGSCIAMYTCSRR